MRKFTFLVIAALFLLSGFTAIEPVQALESTIEEYSISHGGTLGGSPAIVTTVSDPSFGNGDANASVRLNMKDESGRLALKVWRVVEPGNMSFALLVFRVEVRAYDETGSSVFSRNLSGFTFGDSTSGNWSRVLNGLPSSARQVKVTYIGNYE